MACLAYEVGLEGPGVTAEIKSATDPKTQLKHDVYTIKVGPIRWNDGQVLQVGFLGGKAWQRQKVAEIAVQWTYHANISFNFDPDLKGEDPYDILVSFDSKQGSWSKLGTHSRNSAQAGVASMNLSGINEYIREENIQRTILHEFGHALGRGHMHQNPWRTEQDSVSFDPEAVYASYAEWPREKVNRNVLAEYDLNWEEISERMRVRMMDLIFPKFDIHSVMIYPFDSSLTLGGNGGTPFNCELSDGDKYAISRAYPM
ncbi:hypothetical protein N0V90_003091 [Kalmusia sp. IMI 367209]|nr:hypothetical protein N0V90_003091 [Kalmusia sp. IMI 367209]